MPLFYACFGKLPFGKLRVTTALKFPFGRLPFGRLRATTSVMLSFSKHELVEA